MDLRPELMPPVLDEALVNRLACFAQEIDCGDPEQTQAQLAAFNQEASTQFEFIDFQGIYGGQDHDTWVRQVLARPFLRYVADITQAELIEMARRVLEGDGEEDAVSFWLDMLEINTKNNRISDLFFWPGEYFGDDDNQRMLSAQQIIEIALNDRDAR